MSEIRYVRISESFVAEFCGLVAQARALVLLGLGISASRYLIHRFVDSLVPTAAAHVGLVSFLSGVPDDDEVQSKAAGGTVLRLTRLESKSSAVLHWVDERLGAREGQVILARPMSTPCLIPRSRNSCRGSRSGSRATAAGTAVWQSSSLARLTSADSSPIPVTSSRAENISSSRDSRRAEFREFADHYVSVLGPKLKAVNDRMLDQLYDRTGGTLYLLRLILLDLRSPGQHDQWQSSPGLYDEPTDGDRPEPAALGLLSPLDGPPD